MEENNIDIKYINVPNICFSLTDQNDKEEVEFKKQRLERGFDDSETWSLRDTIANFIIPRLERYEEIVNDIIERDDLNVNQINDFLTAMKLISRDKGICIFTEEEKNAVSKGLYLFPKIFMGLWW